MKQAPITTCLFLDHLAIEVRENDGLLFSLDRNGAEWINHSDRKSASPPADEASPP